MTESTREVVVVNGHGDRMPHPASLSIRELARLQGITPVRSLDDLRADVFESDEEVDEFIAFTYAARRRDMA